MIGKTLGNFQCSSLLGKGGMGEVYKAKDQKLGRDVAIKVLPEEFAKDADRVARFQREAKLLASLNHPNIASIYGLEEAEGTSFLVLELIEGDTLADRIKGGPIPVEESLKLALQIAEALEAAHEKGVIHRDLKPANIKVTPDGKVKVLDFGLAKAYAAEQEEVNLSNSPTLSDAATQQGVILGTAAYMSPEQARGKPVDKRADVWAFGCVLYEMLTGKAAFSGRDVTDILAAVIRAEPEWKGLPAGLHTRIRLMLERCLEKEARNRCSNIGEARADIQKALADPSGVFMQPVAGAESRKRLRGVLIWITATILVAIITALVVWRLRPSEPYEVLWSDYELPADQTFTGLGRPLLALSPDGTKIVYVANHQLYLRSLSEPRSRPIEGTDEDPTTPFFSPDGQWVGYYSQSDGQLKKIKVSGGSLPAALCEASNPYGASWGADDRIMFGQPACVMSIGTNGGAEEKLIEVERGNFAYGPQVLPGGEWVLFTYMDTTRGNWDYAQIVAQSLKTGERKILIQRGSDARYLPTGHIVYALGGVLYAKIFDVDRMEARGGDIQVIEGVKRATGQFTGTANYCFSDTGMLAYVAGSIDTSSPPRILLWVNREGKEEPLNVPPDIYGDPRISPDGTKVAVTIETGDRADIFIWDLVRKNRSRLTFDERWNGESLWTPDGKRIVFRSNRFEPMAGIYWKAANGLGNAEQIGKQTGGPILPYSWSGDGKVLVVGGVIGEATSWDIGMLSTQGDQAYTPLLNEEYFEIQPRISPDGKWMAFASSESGKEEVYVRPFPNVNEGIWQVSINGGYTPLWSPDGRELFYLIEDRIISASVETEPTFNIGNRKTLFHGAYVSGYGQGIPWDIHPNGKQFLMMKEVGSSDDLSSTAEQRKINIVLNWFEELKERVPVE